MSGQGPHQGLSYNRRFTITDCWEQREWNAPAHLFGEWRRDSTRSGEHECLCLCINISDLNRYAPQAQQQSTVSHTVGHLALIKQAQEDGPDAGTHEHWHMHPWCTSTCLATRTSLSPLPPSGWMMISSLLSADAKLWIIDEMSERPQQQSARMTDTYRERERDMAGTAGFCLRSALRYLHLYRIKSATIIISFFFFYLLQQNILQTSEKKTFHSACYPVWWPQVIWPWAGQLYCLLSSLTLKPLTPCLSRSMNNSSPMTHAHTLLSIPLSWHSHASTSANNTLSACYFQFSWNVLVVYFRREIYKYSCLSGIMKVCVFETGK